MLRLLRLPAYRLKRVENSRFPAPLVGGAMLKAPMLSILAYAFDDPAVSVGFFVDFRSR